MGRLRFSNHLRAAALGLTGLVGVAIIAAAAVHLVWVSVAGESPVLRDAIDSLARWVDDPAREGAIALLGVGFLLVASMLCAAALVRLREGRVRVARHGRASTDVDRSSLAGAIERALRGSEHEGARVSVSRRRRVNVTLPGAREGSVGDAASAAREAVDEWCGSHGVPCRAGRVTVERHEDDARVDPAPAKRQRSLQ